MGKENVKEPVPRDLPVVQTYVPPTKFLASHSTPSQNRISHRKELEFEQKERILELKQRYFEDYYSDNQYAVSIKEDTAYLCLHSPKTTKDTRPIRRIQEGTKGESSRNLKDLKDHNEFAPLADNSLEVLTMNSNQLNDWIIIQRKHSADLSALAPWSLSSACFAPQHSQRKSARSDALASCDHRARDRTSLRSEEYKVDRNLLNGTKIYHGLMRNHGLILEFGLNPNQLSIIVNPSIIKLNVRRWDKHVVGRMMDTEKIGSHVITYLGSYDELEYEDEAHDERQELCEARKLPVCNMRRFMMIKYSFGQDEEYVAIKEDEYD
ncbi:hypothetical protein Tco_0720059 [Tanacetum coccineum]